LESGGGDVSERNSRERKVFFGLERGEGLEVVASKTCLVRGKDGDQRAQRQGKKSKVGNITSLTIGKAS